VKKRSTRIKRASTDHKINPNLAYIVLVVLIITAIALFTRQKEDIVGQAAQTIPQDKFVECPPDTKCDGYIIELMQPSILEEKAKLDTEIKAAKNAEQKTGDLAGKASFLKRQKRSSAAAQARNNYQNLVYQQQIRLQEQRQRIEQEQRYAIEAAERKLQADLKVKNEHKLAINAIVAEVTEEEAKKVSELPEVKRVYPNVEVKAMEAPSIVLSNQDELEIISDMYSSTGYTSQDPNVLTLNDPTALLTESVDLIGVSLPNGDWQQGYTGTGITIGIIDTGVDYTHSDLGGCFGQNCKVISGYDFVNNDADPMDDQGHGTHVAATSAGKGDYNNNGIRDINEFWGIAPDAKIVAYKVLSSSGSGTAANIIAAIERSIDPNQDGDTSDRIHIISLSLGGPGDPDDPMSRSIDRAVENGVVAVVAAGNSGPAERTIGSPGTAREALTVGAVDINKQIAPFSSRGPVVWGGNSLNKPDIVAPGVNICAAQWRNWLDDRRCATDQTTGDHIAISGTSMATPHVSGMAALLKQKHPDWNAKEIKSALKFTAQNLGLSANEQGQGFLTNIDRGKLPLLAIETRAQTSQGVDIYGTAFADTFIEYTLSYTKENTLHIFHRSSTPVTNGFLGRFDTTFVSDGSTDIILTVVFGNNEQVQEKTTITVDNFVITNPLQFDVVRNSVDITGSIPEGFPLTIEHKRKDEPDSSYTSDGILYIRQDANIAQWDASAIAEPSEHLLRIRSELRDGVVNTGELDVFIDPTLKEGWPQRIHYERELFGMPWYAGPLRPGVGNVIGDEKKEIVLTKLLIEPNFRESAKILIYDSEGNILNTFVISGEEISFHHDSSPPLLVNMDDDAELEIVIASIRDNYFGTITKSEIFAFNADGSSVPGFPYSINNINAKPFFKTIKPKIMSADLNGDKNMEIITYFVNSNADQYGSYSEPRRSRELVELSVHMLILDNNGRLILDWNKPIADWWAASQGLGYYHLRPTSAPAVGNFDDDSNLEIVIPLPYNEIAADGDSTPRLEGYIYVINEDGSTVPNWPKSMHGLIHGPVTVADLNEDKQDDVIVPLFTPYYDSAYADYFNEFGLLIALDRNANILPGWPALKDKYARFISSISIGDVNADGNKEVIAIDSAMLRNTPLSAYVVNKDGQILQDVELQYIHPYELINSQAFGIKRLANEPANSLSYNTILADFNSDGKNEIIGGFSDGEYSVINKWGIESSAIDDDSNIPLQLEHGTNQGVYYGQSTPILIDDIDNDGVMDLVATTHDDRSILSIEDPDHYLNSDGDSKYRGTIYVWNLNEVDSADWSGFQHDRLFTGNYNFDAELGCIASYDSDNDGFGTSTPSQNAVKVCKAGDCNDNNPSVNPSSQETCDALDNNCNSEIDENNVCVQTFTNPAKKVSTTNYRLYPTETTAHQWCTEAGQAYTSYTSGGSAQLRTLYEYLTSWAAKTGTSTTYSPYITELKCSITAECINSANLASYYQDLDGDGFGNSNTQVKSCTAFSNYVAQGNDCNDANKAFNPGVAETCDTKDNNCDDQIDENDVCASVQIYESPMKNGYPVSASINSATQWCKEQGKTYSYLENGPAYKTIIEWTTQSYYTGYGYKYYWTWKTRSACWYCSGYTTIGKLYCT